MMLRAYIVLRGEISPNALNDKLTFQTLGETSEISM